MSKNLCFAVSTLLALTVGCSSDPEPRPVTAPIEADLGSGGSDMDMERVEEPVDAQGDLSESTMDMGADTGATEDAGGGDEDMNEPDMAPCIPESDEVFCQRLMAECGMLAAPDNCGTMRQIETCGVCQRPQICQMTPNEADEATECGCSVESTAEICMLEGKLCGKIEPPCSEIVCAQFCVEETRGIAAGNTFTCALGKSEKIRCWGDNRRGQLGLGDKTVRKNPEPVTSINIPVTQIEAGGAHTCALLEDTGVICWGDNSFGQLGNGTTQEVTSPDLSSPMARAFSAGSGVAKIALGNNHSCALVDLDYDASTPNIPPAPPYAAYCWGSNARGAIGSDLIEVGTKQGTPQLVTKLAEGVFDIGAGRDHNCAIVDAKDSANPEARKVGCWGAGEFGQLGARPILKAPDRSPDYIYADSYRKGAPGVSSQTFVETQDPNALTILEGNPGPFAFATGSPFTGEFVEVDAGQSFSCVRTTSGEVWCWGFIPYKANTICDDPNLQVGPDMCTIWPPSRDYWRGQFVDPVYPIVEQRRSADTPQYETSGPKEGLPSGTLTARAAALRPVRVNHLDDPMLVPSTSSASAPVQATRIVAHFEHLCMLLEEPDPTKTNIYCLGHNALGEVGIGSDNPTQYPTPTLADVDGNIVRATDLGLGDRHTCAVTEDSNVKCWGSNSDDQLGTQLLMRGNTFIPEDVRLR